MDEVQRMADAFKAATEELVSSPGSQVDVGRLQAGILAMAGQQFTATDPEPPVGSVVVDDCGLTWENDGYRPCCWVRPDLREQGIHDPETWTKIAGNYGPVTVVEWGGA